MYQTIRVSSCVLVQGEFVEALADGRVVVRDGKTEYRGQPVARRTAPQVPHGAISLNFDPALRSA